MADGKVVKKQYPLVDLLRFVAALCVVFLHLVASNRAGSLWTQFNPAADAAVNTYSSLNPYVFNGFVGVEIFFSISGYVIFMSAERTANALTFFEHRLLRILPVLWIASLFGAGVLYAFSLYGPVSILNMLLHSMFIIPAGPYIDGVIWTIVVEMIFYLAVAFVMSVWSSKKLPYLAFALIVVSTLFQILYVAVPSLSANRLAMELARRSLLEHGVFFGLGMLIYIGSFRGLNLLMYAIGLVGAFIQIDVSVNAVLVEGARRGATHNTMVPFLFYCAALLVIHIGKFAYTEKSSLWSWLCRQIGLMTYPLYLVHFISGHLIYAWLVKVHPGQVFDNLCLTIVAVIAIAFLVSNRIEPQVRKLMAPALAALFQLAQGLVNRVRPAPRLDLGDSAGV